MIKTGHYIYFLAFKLYWHFPLTVRFTISSKVASLTYTFSTPLIASFS